jgi:phosphopantothenoylcysteine decarboxylase/phosphopantothenate--cysteine ligase
MEFIQPNITEGRAKVADPDVVLTAVLARFADLKLKGKNVLITAGATIEHIDPMRVITNPASGKLGAAIAEEAARLGANVTMIYGQGSALVPSNVHVIRARTSEEMMSAVVNELQGKSYDIAIMTAAVSDFTPANPVEEKIETRNNEQITVTLKTTGKIVDQIKKVSPKTFLIAFKADYNISNEQLVQRAYGKMKECNADMIVTNDVGREGSKMGSDTIEVFMVSKEKRILHLPLQSKKNVAKRLIEEAQLYL